MVENITPQEILTVITDYLATALDENIITLKVTGNPRADSLANQKPIGDALRTFALAHPLFNKHGIVFEVPLAAKNWCDFIIRTLDNRLWLPVNLKVSSFQGRDDLASKEGLYFALTGEAPQARGIMRWKRFTEEIPRQLKLDSCTADYYYLVVQKNRGDNHPNVVFWSSLLKLQTVHPNGNRPPFQCCWSENTTHSDRTRADAIRNLLTVLGRTLELRALARDAFEKNVRPLLQAWQTVSLDGVLDSSLRGWSSTPAPDANRAGP